MASEALNCMNCRGRVETEVLDYGMKTVGLAYVVGVCPAGHRTTNVVPLEPPPGAERLEDTRTYVMGACAGFAAGQMAEGKKLAAAVRVLRECGISPATLSLSLGMSRESVRRMLAGEYPIPRRGTYERAAGWVFELGAVRSGNGGSDGQNDA